MAGSRTQKNKSHKTRFSSKSTRRTHKTSTGAVSGFPRSTNPVASTARLSRLTRNKNIRDQKRAAFLAEKRSTTALNCPPRILALVGLSSGTDTEKVKDFLLTYASREEKSAANNRDWMDSDEQGTQTSVISFPRYKLRLTVFHAQPEDLEACLEISKVADAIVFVTTATTSEGQEYVDKLGNQCLSMLKAQGLPMVMGMIMGLKEVPDKRRSDVKKVCISELATKLPEDCKIFCADVVEDCQQVLRYLSEHRFPTPVWRSQRPFVIAQQLQFIPDLDSSEKGVLQLSGYLRSRNLSVNQLIHLGGVGDFQLQQLDILTDPYPLKKRNLLHVGDEMEVEETCCAKIACLLPDEMLQEPLIFENTPDSLVGEQTWPTQEELAAAMEETHQNRKKKILPKGTSEYQAAWIIENSDSESDQANHNNDYFEGLNASEKEGEFNDEDDVDGGRLASVRDSDDETQSEMMVEEELTAQEREAEHKRLKAAYSADEEFPDEMDTPMDVPARQRFAKYRGLKSFRTSTWDPKESLPQEYGQIFSFDNFQRTYKHALSKADDVDKEVVGGSVGVGSYITLHIRGVQADVASELLGVCKSLPSVASGLLQHESKMSVLHFSIKKHDTFSEPLKSKDKMIFHVGFRKYEARPIFSSDDINMDKHKYERFLHPGRFSLASVFAPISFPPLPLLVFKESSQGNVKYLAASGSLRSVDPDRIILRRIVLSGYPQRVSKQKAVVRFMFHNPEDVRWFKPLELWTKYGRRGRIREPVGTHGAMKCIFDGVLQQRDAVCISLYKRVYPKWPKPLYHTSTY